MLKQRKAINVYTNVVNYTYLHILYCNIGGLMNKRLYHFERFNAYTPMLGEYVTPDGLNITLIYCQIEIVFNKQNDEDEYIAVGYAGSTNSGLDSELVRCEPWYNVDGALEGLDDELNAMGYRSPTEDDYNNL